MRGIFHHLPHDINPSFRFWKLCTLVEQQQRYSPSIYQSFSSRMNLQSFPDPSSPVRAREGSFDMNEANAESKEERRQELAEMARSLRRMKRQLFLMHVEDNQMPALNLRELLLKAASDSKVKGTPPSSPRHIPPTSPRSPPTAM